MDMSQVRRMGLFAVRLPEPHTVYLLDLRLD
ncbi:MAG TPA: succinyl-CoA synthetase subunit beta, partial [Marinobacter adhaerens]|nr:succinyl-CoA synthetase subunit beta [Marinobacter adhaerens]